MEQTLSKYSSKKNLGEEIRGWDTNGSESKLERKIIGKENRNENKPNWSIKVAPRGRQWNQING